MSAVGWSIGCLVALLCGELMARVHKLVVTAPSASRASTEPYVRHHSRWGWSLIPHAHTRHRQTDFDVTVRINEQGIRADGAIAARSRPRALVVGDSFTFGFGVNVDERFGDVANERLGHQMEVVSHGIEGFGTDQQLLMLRDVGASLEPDVVVLAFLVEHIYRNANRGHPIGESGIRPKPWFRLKTPEQRTGADARWTVGSGAERLELRGVPVPEQTYFDADLSRRHVERHSQLADFPLKAWLRDNSELYVFLRSRLLPLLKRREGGIVDPYPTFTPTHPDWHLTRALIRAHRDASAKLGANFMVLVLPTRAYVEFDEIDREPFELLTTLGEEDGFEVVHVLDSLRRAQRSDVGGMYFEHDSHFSPAGHAVAGHALARALDRLSNTEDSTAILRGE